MNGKLILARIGDMPAKRLAWLLRFMNTDLTLLRQEEQTALGCDLEALWIGLDVPDNIIPPLPIFSLQIMDQSEVGEIQKWIKDGFAALFSEESNSWSFSAPKEIRLVRNSPLNAKRLDLTLITVLPTGPSREGQRQRIELAILYVVFEGRDLLRACSECKSPFIPGRRQEYCSTKCSHKARDKRRSRRPVKKSETPPLTARRRA